MKSAPTREKEREGREKGEREAGREGERERESVCRGEIAHSFSFYCM